VIASVFLGMRAREEFENGRSGRVAGCGDCSERARLVPDGCSEGQTGEAGRNRLADTASSATPRVRLRSGEVPVSTAEVYRERVYIHC
jgi:hypothetical protein